eukprot:4842405-Amphidinium_carterae.1
MLKPNTAQLHDVNNYVEILGSPALQPLFAQILHASTLHVNAKERCVFISHTAVLDKEQNDAGLVWVAAFVHAAELGQPMARPVPASLSMCLVNNTRAYTYGN